MKSRMDRISAWRLAGRIALAAMDVCAIWFMLRLAWHIRFQTDMIPVTRGMPPYDIYYRAFFVAAALWMMLLFHVRLYQQRRMAIYEEILRIIRAVAIGAVLLMVGLFLFRDLSYSRAYVAVACVMVAGALICIRVIQRLAWRYLGPFIPETWMGRPRTLLVGNSKITRRLLRLLEIHPHLPHEHIDGLDPARAEDYIRSHEITEVIYAEHPMKPEAANALASTCERMGVDFRLVPELLELRLGELSVDDGFGIPMFHLKPIPLKGLNFFAKRMMDVGIAMTILALAAIPLAAIALVIKVYDGGPVFYRHRRMGHLSRTFEFLKFRTMVPKADDMLAEIRHRSERPGPVFKMRNDPRVTPFGKWLRRYSLDEIPQLFNVLRGDMSLVGPRPQVLWEAAKYDTTAMRRLKILPGITGLWQVSGRADLSYEDMIRLDLFYLENWSFGLDIELLMRTIPVVLNGRGAY